MSEEHQEAKPRSLRYTTVLTYIKESEEMMLETVVEPTSVNILVVAQMLQKSDIAMNRMEIER